MDRVIKIEMHLIMLAMTFYCYVLYLGDTMWDKERLSLKEWRSTMWANALK